MKQVIKMKQIILLVAFAALTFSVQGRAQQAQLSSKEIRKNKREEIKHGEMKRGEIKKDRHTKNISLKTLNGEEISYQTKQQFITDFPDITGPQWNRTAYFDEATFTGKNGRLLTAYYDDQSNLVGTTYNTVFSELPADAQKRIKKEYPDCENAPVVFFDDDEANESDMILYGTQFDDADNYFVELNGKHNRLDILRVSMDGEVSFFREVSR